MYYHELNVKLLQQLKLSWVETKSVSCTEAPKGTIERSAQKKSLPVLHREPCVLVARGHMQTKQKPLRNTQE